MTITQEPAAGRARAEGLVGLLAAEFDRRWAEGSSPLDDICRYALVPVGKSIRPLLLLESAAAVGAPLEWVLPAAIGAECGHVASLVHDDIIDGDAVRRGRTAVHRKYGLSDAIVAGDALIFRLFACLAECRHHGVGAERVVLAFETVAAAGIDLCRGQSLEAQLCAAYDCDVEAYLRMIRWKTASLFQAACASGAVLGGGSPEEVRTLGAYGQSLGVAFQIQDDLLAYTSDSTTTGKAAASDLRNRRLTLPILLARAAGGERTARLVDECLLADDAEQALESMAGLLTQTGALEQAAATARRHARAAVDSAGLLPPSPSRETLAYVAELSVNRAG